MEKKTKNIDNELTLNNIENIFVEKIKIQENRQYSDILDNSENILSFKKQTNKFFTSLIKSTENRNQIQMFIKVTISIFLFFELKFTK